jgi:hypothetical protein
LDPFAGGENTSNLQDEDLRKLHLLWKQLYRDRRFPGSTPSDLPDSALPDNRVCFQHAFTPHTVSVFQ